MQLSLFVIAMLILMSFRICYTHYIKLEKSQANIKQNGMIVWNTSIRLYLISQGIWRN